MKKLGRFVFPVALALMLGVNATQWVASAFAADGATPCGTAATSAPAGPHDYMQWSDTRPDNGD